MMTRTFTVIATMGLFGCAVGGPDEPEDIPVTPFSVANPTRDEAQAVLDRVVALYQGHAAASAGHGRLVGDLQWDNDGSDAHVTLAADPMWTIVVTGGLVRSAEMTPDLLAVTLCHEAGHLVGGFPFKHRLTPDIGVRGTVVAAESQSDYFATKDCLPRLWAGESAANAAALAALDGVGLERCKAAFSDVAAQGICARSALSAVQMGRWLVSRTPAPTLPQLDTPDTSTVEITRYDGYADTQCRIDTLFAGAQCPVKNTGTGTGIPGLLAPYGEFSYASEDAARPFACQTGAGARPRCWFQPKGVWTDCSILGETSCATDEHGDAGILTCNANLGVSFFSCVPAGGVCKVDEEFGNLYCGRP